VHVELEQVEERVADEWDGTVELRFDAIVELERLARLFACREGCPLDFVRCILEVFARLSEALGRYEISYPLLCCLREYGEGSIRVPSHALDLDGGAIVVGGRSNALMLIAADARREQGDGG